MLGLHLPWLELAIVTPLAGMLLVWKAHTADQARARALAAAGLALFLAVGTWEDFGTLHTFDAHDRWDLVSRWMGEDFLVVDELSAPLLPLAALLFFAMILGTLRTKVHRFPFAWTLLSESLVLAMLSTRSGWWMILLVALQALPPLWELRSRGRPVRPFALHMAAFVALLAGGWAIHRTGEPGGSVGWLGMSLVAVAVLIRNGVIPFHCWMTDLFENATLGTSLLYVTPMAGAYIFMRLVLPDAPPHLLAIIAIASLVTTVYAAGMALVQRETRRFFCYLFLSHSSLVLVGLETLSPIGLTGGLCVWLSVGLTLAGFGLTLRAIESRTGRISLADYHGLYDHVPMLAVFFLLTGLASVGFPGTVGFIASELLVEGAIQSYPYVGALVVLAAALNGIAVLHAFFRLFTGTQHTTSVSLTARWPERLAVLVFSLLILGGGLFPQPGVHSRYHAASELLSRRARSQATPDSNSHHVAQRSPPPANAPP